MSRLSTSFLKSHQSSALIAGIAAFTTWGLIPVYWKLLKDIPASQILAHRFVWTSLFLVAVLSWQRRWPELMAVLRSVPATLYCFSSGVAIALNWFFFIYAVNIGRIIETSLGYFMTPLINVLFGAIFLGERLTRWQMVSVALATSAVAYLTFGYGYFPWIAMALCVTFGFYGLLRKQSRTAAIPGLFLETASLAPAALAFLILTRQKSVFHFTLADGWSSVLLISTGVVTAVPLFWFGHAARYLRLTTLGFLQYLSPTGSFFLGVFLYHEEFTRRHLFTFALIWIGLAVFTIEALTRWRSERIRRAMEEAIWEPV